MWNKKYSILIESCSVVLTSPYIVHIVQNVDKAYADWNLISWWQCHAVQGSPLGWGYNFEQTASYSFDSIHWWPPRMYPRWRDKRRDSYHTPQLHTSVCHSSQCHHLPLIYHEKEAPLPYKCYEQKREIGVTGIGHNLILFSLQDLYKQLVIFRKWLAIIFWKETHSI